MNREKLENLVKERKISDSNLKEFISDELQEIVSKFNKVTSNQYALANALLISSLYESQKEAMELMTENLFLHAKAKDEGSSSFILGLKEGELYKGQKRAYIRRNAFKVPHNIDILKNEIEPYFISESTFFGEKRQGKVGLAPINSLVTTKENQNFSKPSL